MQLIHLRCLIHGPAAPDDGAGIYQKVHSIVASTALPCQAIVAALLGKSVLLLLSCAA